MPADLSQMCLRVLIHFSLMIILTFVGCPREARFPSFFRTRFTHQTALGTAHRASRGVGAWQSPVGSAGVLSLLDWTHPCARLVCICNFGSSTSIEVLCLSNVLQLRVGMPFGHIWNVLKHRLDTFGMCPNSPRTTHLEASLVIPCNVCNACRALT